jgi:hypothetical protein
VTKRWPLAWHQVGTKRDILIPDCPECFEHLTQPMMAEAVYSVAIETGGDPAAMARRVVDRYHANRHREG